MDDQQPPASRYHPTIYFVRLEQLESARWEAKIPGFNEKLVAEWRKKAKLSGKKTIEVWGKYCKLGVFPVEET